MQPGCQTPLASYSHIFGGIDARRNRDELSPPDVAVASAPPATLSEAIVRHLESLGLGVAIGEDPSWVSTRLAAGEADVELTIAVGDELGIVWSYGVIRGRVPADRRRAVAEILTRINWAIRGVCFDMDFSDGELRVRGLLDGMSLDNIEEPFARLLAVTVERIADWYPALMAVSFADGDPEELFDRELLAQEALAAESAGSEGDSSEDP